jgi:hypothetical protein
MVSDPEIKQENVFLITSIRLKCRDAIFCVSFRGKKGNTQGRKNKKIRNDNLDTAPRRKILRLFTPILRVLRS